MFTSRGIVKAVDNVSLEIDRGEAIALVGESGCGKTMTALSISRLLPPTARIVSGEIVFNGQDLVSLAEEQVQEVRGRMISIVFQDPMTFLNPVMKIGDQIAEGIEIHEPSVRKDEIEERAIGLLERVGMPYPHKVRDMYPHQLSGGMRQRVMIAIALSCNPALVIADEPTTALDVTIQAQLLSLLQRLIKERQTSLLLISHDLGIVAQTCNRAYIMYAGRIVEHGDIYSIFEDPKHPYTTGLLRSVLSIDQFKEELYTIEGTVPNLLNPPTGCRFHPRCSFARDVCSKIEPALLPVGNEHYAACLLYGDKR